MLVLRILAAFLIIINVYLAEKKYLTVSYMNYKPVDCLCVFGGFATKLPGAIDIVRASSYLIQFNAKLLDIKATKEVKLIMCYSNIVVNLLIG